MTGLHPNPSSSTDEQQDAYRASRIRHWDHIAVRMDTWQSWGRYYHDRLETVYQGLVAPGSKVLEIGCGRGDLLAAVKPETGIGIDFSEEMLARARVRHPHLQFFCADAHDFELDGTFDVILLSDLINDLWDVQKVFERVADYCTPRTRVVINFYSRLWEPLLAGTMWLGLSRPLLFQNWLTFEDTANLLDLAGFEVLRHDTEVLWPLPPRFAAGFFNKWLVRFWPIKHLALTHLVTARPKPKINNGETLPLVSVIVPARNEAGNIPAIFERVPQMGRGTELVFIEGHSTDNTWQVIQEQAAANPQVKGVLGQQTGVGKGDAVRLGFEKASGEIVMILDADLTVPPEDLPRFYQALMDGTGELINGVRLVYPLEENAMRFLNLLGNKFFSLAFSWLLGQPIKDTLCGTKALWKSDYQKIAANRSYFGEFDPFGDFDLIFNAARLGMKIVDMPIRYRERTYGSTNIQRWTHGLLLFRMLLVAARRIKFV